jgi:hypothetical protein
MMVTLKRLGSIAICPVRSTVQYTTHELAYHSYTHPARTYNPQWEASWFDELELITD